MQDLAGVKSPRVKTPSLHDLIWEESQCSSASIMLMRHKRQIKSWGSVVLVAGRLPPPCFMTDSWERVHGNGINSQAPQFPKLQYFVDHMASLIP